MAAYLLQIRIKKIPIDNLIIYTLLTSINKSTGFCVYLLSKNNIISVRRSTSHAHHKTHTLTKSLFLFILFYIKIIKKLLVKLSHKLYINDNNKLFTHKVKNNKLRLTPEYLIIFYYTTIQEQTRHTHT